MKNHPKCRPPRGAIDVRRLDLSGKRPKFIPDDGKPGVAFFGLSKEDAELDEADQLATAWAASCSCKVHAECPLAKALDKACEIYDGCSIERRPKVQTLKEKADAEATAHRQDRAARRR